MAFSFGFGGDDIDTSLDIDALQIVQTPVAQTPKQVGLAPEYQPKLQSLESLLKASVGVRMSYSTTNSSLPRRDLFDVKHQLMLQDSLTPTEEILLGLTNEDLRVAQYEGGLKSWECTYDVVEFLSQNNIPAQTIVELGCGTGVPCLYMLQQYFQQNSQAGLNLIMADYNESVLRLVTAPNLLFAWLQTLDPETRLSILSSTSQTSNAIAEARLGEAEITEALITEFLQVLNQRSISIQFISGGWSPEFVQLLNSNLPAPVDLIIASETVYSLDTLPIFTDTLLGIFKKSPHARALVAAKQVYFGVGGGVLEFIQTLKKHPNVAYEIVYTNSGNGLGVARTIVEVRPSI
ncbi:uncharacterized protein SAPINGB_P001239 [Magnusiomyces paraingens]|uniref:protein-histidine N-methyltransferase n=1 Tax=Magnusiomyces paraingens TaxID=2606893 RepID=A0A5E8B4P9_9ASCO|nr:uncharacterized protein SAPINGB_P001239 [Saprochaete ingens]VVT46490.1 unnamed protein product [Saprochaete ingens]